MEEDISVIDNLQINRKENTVSISINPNLYPVEVIYSAAYIFINQAYVMIDGDPKEEILVRLKPKNSMDLETLGREFNNELVNYMAYLLRTVRSQGTREEIVQRAMATNSQAVQNSNTKS
jgi:His-Xaa-Ser system protein HxsD